LTSERDSLSLVSRREALWVAAGSLLFSIVFLYPMLWMALSSFKSSNAEIFGQPFSLPHQIGFANYLKAIRQGNMGSCFINSLWVTGLSASAVVCFGAWAGFALSKARFPLRKFWLALFFIGMILPVQSYLIPLTRLLEQLGIHDSLWALILSYTAQSLPVAVLLFALSRATGWAADWYPFPTLAAPEVAAPPLAACLLLFAPVLLCRWSPSQT